MIEVDIEMPGNPRKVELLEALQNIVQPILASLEMELVEVVYSGHSRSGVVRVFIDRPGGVTLEDCERAHQHLGYALDAADPIAHAYTLEVSSPGLDRPLRVERDFLRHRGERVRIQVSSPVAGKREWRGEIEGADREKVLLRVSKDQVVQVPLSEVAQAKLLIGERSGG